MVSKHYTTQGNHCDKVEQAIQDCFRRTITYQLSFDEYLAEAKKTHEHPSRVGLTDYYKGYLHGVSTTLFHHIQRDCLEWMMYYTNKNGKVVYVKKWERLPKYIKYSGNFNGNHFWKNVKGRKRTGPPKPFGNCPSNGVVIK